MHTYIHRHTFAQVRSTYKYAHINFISLEQELSCTYYTYINTFIYTHLQMYTYSTYIYAYVYMCPYIHRC